MTGLKNTATARESFRQAKKKLLESVAAPAAVNTTSSTATGMTTPTDPKVGKDKGGKKSKLGVSSGGDAKVKEEEDDDAAEVLPMAELLTPKSVAKTIAQKGEGKSAGDGAKKGEGKGPGTTTKKTGDKRGADDMMDEMGGEEKLLKDGSVKKTKVQKEKCGPLEELSDEGEVDEQAFAAADQIWDEMQREVEMS